MKEGKLGTSPKVVVVHPDGRIEEVTAKLQSLSQSKPVDDFLVSLGVTSDTQFGKILFCLTFCRQEPAKQVLFANIEGPDEMPHYVAYLHCLF